MFSLREMNFNKNLIYRHSLSLMSTALDFSALLKAAKSHNSKKGVQNSQTSSNAPLFSTREIEPSFVNSPHHLRIENLERVFYFGNCISIEEEQRLLNEINSSAQTKWVQLTQRRLAVFGGTPSVLNTVREPLPDWIESLISNVIVKKFGNTPTVATHEQSSAKATLNFAPNHVLLNEYSQGMGIGAHFDGPQYHDRVIVLNLQAPARFYFSHTTSDGRENTLIEPGLLLEPRSILIFEGELYTKVKHGILNAPEDIWLNKPLNFHLLEQSMQERLAQVSDTNPVTISRTTLPRLSLTLRKLFSTTDDTQVGEVWEEAIQSQQEKENKKRDLLTFYKSVSEISK